MVLLFMAPNDICMFVFLTLMVNKGIEEEDKIKREHEKGLTLFIFLAVSR